MYILHFLSSWSNLSPENKIHSKVHLFESDSGISADNAIAEMNRNKIEIEGSLFGNRESTPVTLLALLFLPQNPKNILMPANVSLLVLLPGHGEDIHPTQVLGLYFEEEPLRSLTMVPLLAHQCCHHHRRHQALHWQSRRRAVQSQCPRLTER